MARTKRTAQQVPLAATTLAEIAQRETVRDGFRAAGIAAPTDAMVDAALAAWRSTLPAPVAAPVTAEPSKAKAKAKADTPAWIVQRGKNSATRKALWAEHAAALNKLSPEDKAAKWAALKAAAGVK